MEIAIDYIDEKTVFNVFGLKHWKTKREFERIHGITPISITPNRRGYRRSDINRILGNGNDIANAQLSRKWTVTR